MYVRVDDGDGIFLSIGSCEGGGDPDRPRGSRLDEFASIHFSFPLVLHLERHWDPNPGCDYNYLVPNRIRSRKLDKAPHMLAQPLLAGTALPSNNKSLQNDIAQPGTLVQQMSERYHFAGFYCWME